MNQQALNGPRPMGTLSAGDADLTELAGRRAGSLSPTEMFEALQAEGYLLLRGFHAAAAVQEVADQLQRFHDDDPSTAIPKALVAPAFLELVEGPRIMAFFSELLAERALTYDFKWVRFSPPGVWTRPHMDRVFMGRGTDEVYTCWTPIGDVPLDRGPLALLLGSPLAERISQTYGRQDVDRDLIAGHLAEDPRELADAVGGRWSTAEFRAGDLLVFGITAIHSSLENRSRHVRISSDTRYQRVTDPVDGRWCGRNVVGHYRWAIPGAEKEPVAAGRARWGF